MSRARYCLGRSTLAGEALRQEHGGARKFRVLDNYAVCAVPGAAGRLGTNAIWQKPGSQHSQMPWRKPSGQERAALMK
jgi:hypothetical protein